MKKHLLVLFLFLCQIPVIAGTIDPRVPDEKYLEYGQQYNCVLPIVGILGDSMNSSFRASCVVIDEYHILTAAHIVIDSITQHVIYKNKAYPCSIVAVHSKFDFKKNGYNDIAIARLQRPINLDFFPELYTELNEKDKICGISGYGFHGTFNTGYQINKYDNKRRAGSNIIDGSEKTILKFSANKPPHTSLEFLIAPGDSGGGVFIDQKLAGINSFIYATDGKADSSKTDVSCCTRISLYIDWISETKKIMSQIIGEK